MVRVIDELRGIHIVGVGGSATSGLACLLRARGVEVTGSDWNRSRLDSLRLEGIDVVPGHAAGNLGADIDLVVHSAAVPDENPELCEARRRGIPVRKYADFLGEWVRSLRTLAVSGTHGKTSTAGMLASILTEAGRDPSYLIGGEHLGFGGNWRSGAGEEFIVEACEFDRSFHAYRPQAGIITSLELDHPDIYTDVGVLVGAFQAFVGGFNEGGILLLNGDSPALREVATPPGVCRRTFGFSPTCDWCAAAIQPGRVPRFEVLRGGERWGHVELSVPGRHSVANALGALALAVELGVPDADVVRGLATFEGIARRFEPRSEDSPITLIDDYAHHPTEVSCALETARDAYPGRRLWAVFQPHQYGRLRSFGGAFASALRSADRVVLVPVYSVRESAAEAADSLVEELHQALRKSGTPVTRFLDLDSAAEYLGCELETGDVCMMLGAGDVVEITEKVTSLVNGVKA